MQPYCDPIENDAEALFNLGKAFHHISLYQFAVPLYEEVLSLSSESDPHELKREAAFNLSLIYRTTGNKDLAHDVLMRYNIFE
jgi:general transcription factor 3C polypeptide 3 (transcription factor C subunit 4)